MICVHVYSIYSPKEKFLFFFTNKNIVYVDYTLFQRMTHDSKRKTTDYGLSCFTLKKKIIKNYSVRGEESIYTVRSSTIEDLSLSLSSGN